jgi:hypothetical protein
MTEEKQHRTPPALARALTLARRADFDLSLLHDSALAVGLPFSQLSKVKRAQREMKDLLHSLSTHTTPPEQGEAAR